MSREWSNQPEFGSGPPGPHGGDPQHVGPLLPTRIKVYLVLGALVGLAVLLLIVQNSDKVEMEWLWFDFKAALWLFFVLSLVAGMIIGQVLMVLWRRSRQRNLRAD